MTYNDVLLRRLALLLELIKLFVDTVVLWVVNAGNRDSVVDSLGVNGCGQTLLWHLQFSCLQQGQSSTLVLTTSILEQLPDLIISSGSCL